MEAKDQPVVQFGDLGGTLDEHKKGNHSNRTANGKVNVFSEGSRGCTDVLLLIIFVLFWIGMVAIGIYAIANSDLNALLHQKDYKGNYCTDAAPKLYIIQTAVSAAATDAASVPAICVSACPNATTTVQDPYADGYGSIYVPVTTYSLYGVCLPAKSTLDSLPALSSYADDLQTYSAWLKRAEKDIYEGRIIILIVGGAISLALAMTWLLLMALCAAPMVWTTILAFFLVFAASAYVAGCNGFGWDHCDSVPYSEHWNNLDVPEEYLSSSQSTTFWKASFFLLVIPATIIFLSACCLWHQIQIAAAILSEVSKALARMFIVVLFPIIPFIMLLVLYVWWCAVSFALYSMDTETTAVNITDASAASNSSGVLNTATTTVMSTVEGTEPIYLWCYHFFGLLWTTQVIEGISLMTISGAFCAWYWRDDKTELGHAPVVRAFYRTMRFHLGTICFGSLVVSIVQFARAVLNYLKHKLEKHGMDNAVVKVFFCILGCCFYCLEHCLKYVGRQAYIITSMRGSSFCNSCFEGLGLLIANAGRVIAVSMCSHFIVTVGKIAIITGTALIGYLWLEGEDDIDNSIAPTMVIVAVSYTVTHIVMAIFDMGTDTILLCVLEDEHANESSGLYFAPPSIQHLLSHAHTPKARDTHQASTGAVVVHGQAPGASHGMEQHDV